VLDVHLEHRRLDPVVNRIAFAMVTAALLLGSSLLWSRNIPPQIGGVSVIGAGGSAVSIYLVFLLIRAIRKSGGM
jgi:ubiquinone biosynthesis protein